MSDGAHESKSVQNMRGMRTDALFGAAGLNVVTGPFWAADRPRAGRCYLARSQSLLSTCGAVKLQVVALFRITGNLTAKGLPLLITKFTG